MKITIAILIIALIALLVFSCSKQSNDSSTSIGGVDDIEKNIEQLMKSSNEYAFLIIKVHGTGDFIQFSGDVKGVQLDFPLVTDKQRTHEAAFRSAGKDMNLNIIENKGSDGSIFLDIDINGTASEIAVIVRRFIEKLFEVNQATRLEFELKV